MGTGARARHAVLAMVCAVHVAAAPPTARAAGAPVSPGPERGRAHAELPSTLLELEGDAPREAVRVSAAIGRALGRRGLDDGRRASLVELRLAMGCEGDEPGCLARGGKSLGAARLVYGALVRDDTRWIVQLGLLDVASASVIRSSVTPLEATALADDALEATADRLVASLFPLAPTSTPPPVVAPAPPPELDADEPRDEGLVWGRQRPLPRWKVAAVATSASVTTVLLAASIGLTVARNVTLREQLLAAVDESQLDENPMNDIDRGAPDICAAARETPPGEPDPNRVTNANVTRICNTADGVSRAAIATWVVTGVGIAATAVFTTLLFVRRAERRSSKRVSLRVGAVPGHVELGVGGRF